MKTITKSSIIFLILSIGINLNAQNIDIAKGAELWADTCIRCHNVREPADLSKRAWKYSMNHMRVRAGLTGDETKNVLAFILFSKTEND